MVSTSQFIVGIIGNVISICLFLSPMSTFWRIYRTKSTGDYSAVPYITTILNCLLWLFYGSPYVSKGILIVTINAAGLLIELFYTAVYLFYTSVSNKRKTFLMLLGVCTFFGVVVLINMLTVSKPDRKTVVGILCIIIGSAMYISPLTIMATVISTRSTKYMPLPLSICNLLNGMAWTTYGIIGGDIFVMIPNAIGVFFALCQLILYSCYCGSNQSPDAETAEGKVDDQSLEENSTTQVP